MSQFTDFLKQLGTDSALRDQYVADPDGTMQAAGLSQAEIDAVKSGDKDQIRAAAGGDANQLGELVSFIFASSPDA